MRALCLLAVTFFPLSTQAATYEIDPAHTSISFRVKHLVTKVSGRFDKFFGKFDYEKGHPEAWKVETHIDAASINTNVGNRDTHLRGADFFDVEKCPEVVFKSTKVTNVKGDTAKLHGDLTMHCVTKPVVLDLVVAGEAKDPQGHTRFGAAATGRISRKEWGLTWNKALESGGLFVGDDVDLDIEVEAVRKGSAPKQ